MYSTLYSFKDELVSCYGYPLQITSLNDCRQLSNLNFKIKIIEDVSCTPEDIIKNGVETNNELNLFVPIKNSLDMVCPGQVFIYFDNF